MYCLLPPCGDFYKGWNSTRKNSNQRNLLLREKKNLFKRSGSINKITVWPGQYHFIHLFFFLIQCIYKGNIKPSRNQAGTGDLLAYPLFCLLITAIIYKLARSHATPSLLQQYQNTATESTANGKISFFASLAIFLLVLAFIIGSIIKSVS